MKTKEMITIIITFIVVITGFAVKVEPAEENGVIPITSLEVLIPTEATEPTELPTEVCTETVKTPVRKTVTVTAYCHCAKCCGKAGGKTASGTFPQAWRTIAAPKSYAFGTAVYIPSFANQPNGGWFVIEDRGGSIKGDRIDIFMSSHDEALKFGRQKLEVEFYE